MERDFDLPSTQAEAVAAGSKHFFTNKPCKHGHVARRTVWSGSCTQCVQAAARSWMINRPGSAAAYTHKHREKKKSKLGVEEYLRRDAEYARGWRAKNPRPLKGRNPIRLDPEIVIGRARSVHGDLYQYGDDYTGMHNPWTITCSTHGPFIQNPSNHLGGANCPKCASKFLKSEQELLDFFSTLGVGTEHRTREIIKPLELDIYLPDQKIAVEYCGVYWHSTLNLDLAIARKKHQEKYNRCVAVGVKLFTVFEDEWKTRRPVVENILRRAVSAQKSIGARSCKVVTVTDPGQFYDDNHIQGRCRAPVSYGLEHNGVLVAVMSFTGCGSNRGKQQWELIRFATSIPVMGAASRLMSRFIQDHNPQSIVSYSDNRYFDGGMYPALGFVLDGDVAPDYRVVYPSARKTSHKSSFRRRLIPNRLREIGSTDTFDPDADPRSEYKVCEENGFGRIYDCGKKRWLWHP